ncbi:MAG: hypothetical protein JSW18_00170 [Candidatus Omnitrophota bacterium]|nr:MAG: hypothetical protein JSW18_00170 [Candidatus Omnitrophota bacterium]
MPGKKVLTYAIIAFVAYVLVFNFFILPNIMLYKQMEFSENDCSDFCSGVSKAARYTTDYNRNTKSLGCTCRDAEGTALIRTFYPVG